MIGPSGPWSPRRRKKSESSALGPMTSVAPAPNSAARPGGDLEQIKFLLGHSSIQTTERYLGSEQEIAVAVNDSLGL